MPYLSRLFTCVSVVHATIQVLLLGRNSLVSLTLSHGAIRANDFEDGKIINLWLSKEAFEAPTYANINTEIYCAMANENDKRKKLPI